MLPKKQQLDPKHRNFQLYNGKRLKNCRDCHIESAWILIYLKDEIVLLLVNTGSHSKVLNK